MVHIHRRSILRVQANPVCAQRGYKQAVLSALPDLTNLDGERSPLVSKLHATVDEADAASKTHARHEPDFSFAPPQRWLSGADLDVPPAGSLASATALLDQQRASAEQALQVCTAML